MAVNMKLCASLWPANAIHLIKKMNNQFLVLLALYYSSILIAIHFHTYNIYQPCDLGNLNLFSTSTVASMEDPQLTLVRLDPRLLPIIIGEYSHISVVVDINA